MDGLLLVDKPAGPTSHDVVAIARRALRERSGERKLRVGHAGTLDPFATGLLLVLAGRATRIQQFVLPLRKTYETVARFGARSDTGDLHGTITETGVVPEGDLALPTGRMAQVPHPYSAVRVQGRRAYELARAGETVELAARDIEVDVFEELWREGDRRAFRIVCSAGTYVRSLVESLGDAYCEELRRTAIGPFSVDEAGPPEDVDRLIPLDAALARFLPRVELSGDEARFATHGRAVAGEAAGPVVLADDAGPIAIAEPRDEGLLKPVVGFRG